MFILFLCCPCSGVCERQAPLGTCHGVLSCVCWFRVLRVLACVVWSDPFFRHHVGLPRLSGWSPRVFNQWLRVWTQVFHYGEEKRVIADVAVISILFLSHQDVSAGRPNRLTNQTKEIVRDTLWHLRQLSLSVISKTFTGNISIVQVMLCFYVDDKTQTTANLQQFRPALHDGLQIWKITFKNCMAVQYRH